MLLKGLFAMILASAMAQNLPPREFDLQPLPPELDTHNPHEPRVEPTPNNEWLNGDDYGDDFNVGLDVGVDEAVYE